MESIEVLCSNCSVPRYEPLDESKIYSVIITSYLVDGGDKFSMFKTDKISFRSLGKFRSNKFFFRWRSVEEDPSADSRWSRDGFFEITTACRSRS